MSNDQLPVTLQPCACVGPLYGEPLCPCMMVNESLPRSKEFLVAQKQSREALSVLTLSIFSKPPNKD